mmetsp:Transcript_25701/g.68644  ORF Transcript_25701/g.68644 Transcript_25701/m.68644 type:complete len:538 (+) Transcript_25701:652-2265(+)
MNRDTRSVLTSSNLRASWSASRLDSSASRQMSRRRRSSLANSSWARMLGERPSSSRRMSTTSASYSASTTLVSWTVVCSACSFLASGRPEKSTRIFEHASSSSWKGRSSRSAARESTRSSAASSLTSKGTSTCRSAQSRRMAHSMLSTTRAFSWCPLIFLLASSALTFWRWSSVRWTLTAWSATSRALFASWTFEAPARTLSSNALCRSSRSCRLFWFSSISRRCCAQSCARASSWAPPPLVRLSRPCSSPSSARTASSSSSSSSLSCRRSRCSRITSSRTSSTPSSALSAAKCCLPLRSSSASCASFAPCSSSCRAASRDTRAAISSARAPSASSSFCSLARAASSAPSRPLLASSWACSSSSSRRACATRCWHRPLSWRSVARSFSTSCSFCSWALMSCSRSAPPNSTERPPAPAACTDMSPFGDMTSPPSVTTLGFNCSFPRRASRYAVSRASSRSSTMTVLLRRISMALSTSAGPWASQRGLRSKNFSLCWTHVVARRRACRSCVRRCSGPTSGGDMRSSGRKVSVGIRFTFR